MRSYNFVVTLFQIGELNLSFRVLESGYMLEFMNQLHKDFWGKVIENFWGVELLG